VALHNNNNKMDVGDGIFIDQQQHMKNNGRYFAENKILYN
jgi:hypothetical protein